MAVSGSVQGKWVDPVTGNTWSKTLGDMTASKVANSEMAKAFIEGYAKIVDGELKSAKRIVSEDVDLA